MTSSILSISVRISWMVCEALTRDIAGAMKEFSTPWNIMIEPKENSPRIVYRTPKNMTE